MAEYDRFWNSISIRFSLRGPRTVISGTIPLENCVYVFIVVFSAGFAIAEDIARNIGLSLPLKWVIISVMAMWFCAFVLAYHWISGKTVTGFTTLVVMGTVFGAGAVVGLIAGAIRSKNMAILILLPALALLVAPYYIARRPLWLALLLAVTVASAWFTRFFDASWTLSELESEHCTDNDGPAIETENHLIHAGSTLISKIFELFKSRPETGQCGSAPAS